MAIVSLAAAIAPTGAQGFIGETSVVVGGDLTGAAKTIIEKPTFLTTNIGEAGLAGGVAEESAAAGVFQSSGLLPALGSVLAFGVGTVIGSEICHVVGIEGCWYHGSEGADPAIGAAKGAWYYITTPLSGSSTTIAPFTGYCWGTSGCSSVWFKAHQDKACEFAGLETPGGLSTFLMQNPKEWVCGPSGAKVFGPREYAIRWSMENRVFDYHASDDPGISNYSHTAPSDWSKKFAKAIEGQPGTTPAGRVGERIASEIKGSGASNPYATVKVPDCTGLKLTPCVEELEELDLKPEVTELDWDDAVIEELDELEPEKTREEEAERVITIVPAPNELVIPGTDVELEVNPEKKDMPQFVPQPDKSGGEDGYGENEDEYKKRLAPIFLPWPGTLGDGTIDPDVGPGSVSHTVPDSDHRFDPHTEHEVKIWSNPADAPIPSGAWSAPSIPAVNFGPLTGVSIGCNDFPFGVFCWLGTGLTSWGPGGECPTIGVPFGASIGQEDELAFDTCQFEPAMEIIRPVLVLLAAFSLAYLFASAAMGFGGSQGED